MITTDSEPLAAARQFEREVPRRLLASDAKRILSATLEAMDPSRSASVSVAEFEALGWLHPALGVEAVARWAAQRDSNSPHFQARRQLAVAACALGSCLRLAESTACRLRDSPSNPAREMLESRLADLAACWGLTRTALADVATAASAAQPSDSIDSAAAAVLVTAMELEASGLQLATSCLSPDSPNQEILADWGRQFVRLQLSEGPWHVLMNGIAEGMVG